MIEARPQDRQSCCCYAHVDNRIIFKECMTFRREILKGKPESERENFPIFEHIRDLVEETMCNKGAAPYHKLACINCQCEDCGTESFKLMPEEEDTSQSGNMISWEKFDYVSVPGIEEKKATKDSQKDYNDRRDVL